MPYYNGKQIYIIEFRHFQRRNKIQANYKGTIKIMKHLHTDRIQIVCNKCTKFL